jgi:4-diphosphocytidyl-2-C-methyl-D-erythritol kinase
MLIYPNAKINLGLHIVEKRADGYHTIETVFYPIPWTDILEVIPSQNAVPQVELTTSGFDIPGELSQNLLVKAWNLVAADYQIPGVKVHLHKLIPMGAGLGGGSSDAAFFLRALNALFDLNLAWGELHHYARQLGADCSFFISNCPVMAEERGDVYEAIDFTLKGWHIVVVHPGIHISTAKAYAGVTPKQPTTTLEEIVTKFPVEQWKDKLVNDFEVSVFSRHPIIAIIKEQLYALGASYASMSGSGSAVYGLFRSKPLVDALFSAYTLWKGEL